jgi:hypothetical protein
MLFSELASHIKELKKQFLDDYFFDPLADIDMFRYPVKAFCILSHAAIEEYIEQIVIDLVSESIDNWIHKNKPNTTLLALLGYYGKKYVVNNDESNITRNHARIRELLDDLKNQFSKDVYENNGIGIRYLRKLIYPVGIDVDCEPAIMSAWQKLAKERGMYAHKKSVVRVLSPEDANQCVEDCLILCKNIAQEASILGRQLSV